MLCYFSIVWRNTFLSVYFLESKNVGYQGRNLFFNGRLIFHILDVETEPRKTSVPSYVE